MNIINNINDKLWLILTIIITIISIYFTIKLKYPQLNLKNIKNKTINDSESSFKSLMVSLAGKIGVGSISGIALAIYISGPGAIFWIWIISILSSSLAYCETYLGIKYQKNNQGGPSYYLKYALNNKSLGAIYSIIILICYVFGYTSIQSNTMTISITSITNIKSITIGIILSIITIIIIYKGTKKIINIISKIVPIMSVIYISLALTIIITNINIIPNIFINIIKNALNIKCFLSGFIPTIITGVQRGIFSTEAGLGTGSIAASISSSHNPQKEGYIQILGVYITSFLICTSTAIIILTSNYQILNINDPNGIEIATYAFSFHFQNIGKIILTIYIFLFALSTILTSYYYGEQSLNYLFKEKSINYLSILKITISIIIFFGSIISPTIIWNITDILIAILALINIYALIKLRKEIN